MSEIVTVTLPQNLFEASAGPFSLKHFRTSSASGFAQSSPDFGGALESLWSFSMQAAPMSREATIEMEAWFARLGGNDWAFRAYDPLRQMPLGEGGGFKLTNDEIKFTDDTPTALSLCSDFRILEGANTALVKTLASRGSTSVLIKGLDTSLSGKTILKRGDQFSIGLPGEMNLHMAVADCVCDASGEARIEFTAPLWKRALPNDLVDFYRPTGRFTLFHKDDNGSVELVRSAGPLSAGALSAIEYPYQEPVA